MQDDDGPLKTQEGKDFVKTNSLFMGIGSCSKKKMNKAKLKKDIMLCAYSKGFAYIISLKS